MLARMRRGGSGKTTVTTTGSHHCGRGAQHGQVVAPCKAAGSWRGEAGRPSQRVSGALGRAGGAPGRRNSGPGRRRAELDCVVQQAGHEDGLS